MHETIVAMNDTSTGQFEIRCYAIRRSGHTAALL